MFAIRKLKKKLFAIMPRPAKLPTIPFDMSFSCLQHGRLLVTNTARPILGGGAGTSLTGNTGYDVIRPDHSPL